jgi:hypothetical protein
MVSLICGVAAYTVTFALMMFCLRYLKARRNAKRGSPPTRKPKEKSRFNSDRFCFLLLCVALAFGKAATRM